MPPMPFHAKMGKKYHPHGELTYTERYHRRGEGRAGLAWSWHGSGPGLGPDTTTRYHLVRESTPARLRFRRFSIHKDCCQPYSTFYYILRYFIRRSSVSIQYARTDGTIRPLTLNAKPIPSITIRSTFNSDSDFSPHLMKKSSTISSIRARRFAAVLPLLPIPYPKFSVAHFTHFYF